MAWRVYKFYDGDGSLLYVGVTAHLEARCACHRTASPWYGEVRYTEIGEPIFEKAAALTAEREAIVAGKPKHNKTKRELLRQPNGVAYGKWLRECASRAARIHALRNKGWTLAKIATEHGISRQRVHQILAAGEE